MKLFEILLEYASIPKTSYGYWIDLESRVVFGNVTKSES